LRHPPKRTYPVRFFFATNLRPVDPELARFGLFVARFLQVLQVTTGKIEILVNPELF